jgi:4-hydroxy-2-oxoheptanedioate aldolase
MKALDTGAAGFVYPGVTTAEDAQEAVSSSLYPPEGTRGACPFVRASGHSSKDWKSFAQRSNRDLVRIILVEGTEGIENLSEIVSVEGVDVIMMGPFDLSVALGVGGEVEHPAVKSLRK